MKAVDRRSGALTVVTGAVNGSVIAVGLVIALTEEIEEIDIQNIKS